MKNFIVPIFLFFACSISAQQISSVTSITPNSKPQVSAIYTDSNITAILNSQQLALSNEVDEVYLQDGTLFWAIKLYSASTSHQYYISIVNGTTSFGNRLLFEIKPTENSESQHIKIVNLSSNIVAVSTTISDWPNNPEQAICRETTQTFSECFSCAWNQLNNNTIGQISCSINPHLCALASAIHCAAG